jgi:hypothetical protein
MQMLRNTRLVSLLGLSMLLAGCTARVGYRAYDPGYSDYHVWGPGEANYYNQWVVEEHRPRRDYRRLNHNDQRQYWQWRHAHPDRR